ncbi:HD domain-containing protein [candidate division KSB1 bacterium]|nr:HD domain-containing protein [candidate division KSB1 bacterium]
MTELGISHEQHQRIEQWFKRYAQQHSSPDEQVQMNLDLKRKHSWRVAGEALMISKELGLPKRTQRLSTLIGLLHDVGRFKQYIRYGTFEDQKSVNHAEFSVQELHDSGVLTVLPATTQRLVEESIRLHNLPRLPAHDDDEILMFARLLRDADKLDIWRIVLNYYRDHHGIHNRAIEHGMPDTPGYSEHILEALLRREAVHYQYCSNLNDFKLKQMCWVFDLNYGPSIQTVIRRRILEQFEDLLPADAKIVELSTELHNYLVHPRCYDNQLSTFTNQNIIK